jgi:hypothetical protein
MAVLGNAGFGWTDDIVAPRVMEPSESSTAPRCTKTRGDREARDFQPDNSSEEWFHCKAPFLRFAVSNHRRVAWLVNAGHGVKAGKVATSRPRIIWMWFAYHMILDRLEGCQTPTRPHPRRRSGSGGPHRRRTAAHAASRPRRRQGRKNGRRVQAAGDRTPRALPSGRRPTRREEKPEDLLRLPRSPDPTRNNRRHGRSVSAMC